MRKHFVKIPEMCFEKNCKMKLKFEKALNT